MGPVLVIGGTGATGGRVVERLVERDLAVRATFRTTHAFPDAVQAVRGDVRDPEAVATACAGVHTLVSCLGNRRYWGRDGMAMEVEGARVLLGAASEAGVQHVIYLSAFGLDRHSPLLTLFSAALGRYFHHKRQVEEAVRASGIPFTLVRPHELRDRPPRGRPVLNQARPLSLLRTVSRDAVAEVLAACVDEPRVHRAVFEVVEGGDEPLDPQLDRLHRDGRLHLPDPHTPLW